MEEVVIDYVRVGSEENKTKFGRARRHSNGLPCCSATDMPQVFQPR